MSELHHIASITCDWSENAQDWNLSLAISHPDGLANTPYFEECADPACELRLIDQMLALIGLDPEKFWPYPDTTPEVMAHYSARQTPSGHRRIGNKWMARTPYCACQYVSLQQILDCLAGTAEFEEILGRLDTAASHTLAAGIDLEYDGDGCWLAFTQTGWEESGGRGDTLTRYYLSARYGRRQEIQAYAEKLEQTIPGARAVSRWHSQPGIAAEDALTPAELTLHPDQGQGYAAQDLDDLEAAQVLVEFSGSDGQGGRHVEYGYALAKGKRLVLVGPRDNVFSCLPQAEWFPSFTAWLEYEKSISR